MNKYNDDISIVIPTFNRSDFLDKSLEIHLPICKTYNINIYIFDNSSSDSTCDVVSKWMCKYDNLIYICNDSNIGSNANFKKALLYPDSKYVWLLGDTYTFTESILDIFFNRCVDYDVIVFNLTNKSIVETNVYNDFNLVLNDIGAILSCSAVSIIKNDVILSADFDKYLDSWYVHAGIILEYLALNSCNLLWVGNQSISSLANNVLRKSNWSHSKDSFYISLFSWHRLNMLLPTIYSVDSRLSSIKEFNKLSGLFSLRGLLMMRSKNAFDIFDVIKYKPFIKFSVSIPYIIVLIISIIPVFLFRFLKNR